jgi:hypothetical protein
MTDPVAELLQAMQARTLSIQQGSLTVPMALAEGIQRLDSSTAILTSSGLRFRNGRLQQLDALEAALLGDGVTPGVL